LNRRRRKLQRCVISSFDVAKANVDFLILRFARCVVTVRDFLFTRSRAMNGSGMDGRIALLAAAAVALVCVGVPSVSRAQAQGEVQQVLPRLQIARGAQADVAARNAAPAARQAGGAVSDNAKAMARLLGEDHPLVRSGMADRPPPATRMGAGVKRTDMSRMHYSVGVRNADGTLAVECEQGESAAVHAAHRHAAASKQGAHDAE
jgi:hypothetical protein